MHMSQHPLREILDDELPSNWGRWGDDDELGTLNYLTNDEVLRGVQAVEKGETFSLGTPIDYEDGDPVWPGRHDADHYMTNDKGFIESGKTDNPEGSDVGVCDDVVHMFTHGTTHFDSLAHVWYDGSLYNGWDPNTTKGGLDRVGAENQGEHGIIGRAVLLDIARHRDVDRLSGNSRITLNELQACADEQGVELEKRDILLLRTGAIESYYEMGSEAYREEYTADHGEDLPEANVPGITYTKELVEWFDEMEIPAFCTDTLAIEQSISDETGTFNPLHGPFLRDLGLSVSEINNFGELAADCEADGKYDFLYVASPLKIHGGSAGPVNPVAIK